MSIEMVPDGGIRVSARSHRLAATEGATAAEYALLLALLAVVIVVSVRLFGSVLVDLFGLYPDDLLSS